eukprot:g81139.t1
MQNAFGTGALECSITAYRGGLSYSLAGQPLETKGLPGCWKNNSYRPGAEQQEVEALAWAPDMCKCFASERRCTEWLQRWWDQPGSERFELCVDAQQHTEQGQAQLFALSVHLRPEPAPPADAAAIIALQ